MTAINLDAFAPARGLLAAALPSAYTIGPAINGRDGIAEGLPSSANIDRLARSPFFVPLASSKILPAFVASPLSMNGEPSVIT